MAVKISRTSCLTFILAFLVSGIGYAAPAVIYPDLPTMSPPRDDLDSYGGWKKLQGKATGFFHVEQIGNRWWFVTPEGNVFWMLQMGYAGLEANDRIRSWGFNTSEPGTGMPYAIDLRMFRQDVPELPTAAQAQYPPWVTFPDVFDPRWPEMCRKHAQDKLASSAKDPLLLGYFLDNEICLSGWYQAATLTKKDAPARAAFVEVAKAYYADKPDALSRDWQKYGVTRVEDLADVNGAPPDVPGLQAAWETAVAERAFGVASQAAREAAPNHLNLGTRMINAPLPSPPILAAMGKYLDVVSLNLYNLYADRLTTPMFSLLAAINALTGRPTLTSELSFRGGDSPLPSTMGALPTVKTQAERAIGYLSYVAAVASLPGHIGVSWYKYPDDKPDAAWNAYAEDCNFGVVDGENRPYAVLTQGMRTVNGLIYNFAADPAQNPSCPLFWRTELMRWDRAQDEILLQRFAGSDQPFIDPMAQMLPEPRRYHEHYWIRHQSPGLTVNDERFAGWCEANIVQTGEDGTALVLFNVQAWTSFPRALWLGESCADADKPIILESNAQYLRRQIDKAGQLRRLTVADGSFARVDYGDRDPFEFRLDKKAAYCDLALDPDAKTATLTVRGPAKVLGISKVDEYAFSCNGAAVPQTDVSRQDGLTVIKPAL